VSLAQLDVKSEEDDALVRLLQARRTEETIVLTCKEIQQKKKLFILLLHVLPSDDLTGTSPLRPREAVVGGLKYKFQYRNIVRNANTRRI
jgi:hypothetical protein